MADHIIPRYKLMLLYDLLPESGEEYYQFVMTELTPMLQEMGLHIFQVFHTVWGECPVRQVEFVVDDLSVMQQALHSDTFLRLEAKLREHSSNYRRKVIKFRPGFQL